MRISRPLRQCVSQVLIAVLLFAQLAVAGHACPRLGAAQGGGVMAAMVAMAADRAAPVTVAAAASEVAAMPPGCHHLAPELPNLCAAHCQQGQQSADTASAALVGLALPAPLYPLALPVPPVPGSGRSFPAHDASLDAVPEPPHAVLHCVLRT